MDTHRLEELLNDFYLISGMDISLSDAAFHGILARRCPLGNLCSHFHRSRRGVDVCRASDAEHMARAKASGLPLRYTCPVGITGVIIPIVKSDGVAAYLLAAMGINRDEKSDDEILCDLERLAPELDPEETAAAISTMMLTMIHSLLV